MHPRKKEFLELFHASGWTQAEAARKLDMTRGGMHGLVQGDTVPSIQTVRLFRLVIQGEHPDARLPKIGANEPEQLQKLQKKIGEVPDWQSEVIRDLDQLSEEDRSDVLEGLRSFLRCVRRRGRRGDDRKAA